MWGAAAVVEALLEAGADVNATDKHGKTALDCTRNPKIINLLKKAAGSQRPTSKKSTSPKASGSTLKPSAPTPPASVSSALPSSASRHRPSAVQTELAKCQADLQASQAREKHLNEVITDLRQRLEAESKASKRQQHEYQDTIDKLKRRIAGLEHENESLKAGLQQAHNDQAKLKRDLHNALDQGQQKDQTIKDLEQSQQATKDAFDHEREQLQQNLESVVYHNTALKLQDKEKDQMVADLELKIKTVQATDADELRQMKEQLESAQKQSATLQQSEKQGRALVTQLEEKIKVQLDWTKMRQRVWNFVFYGDTTATHLLSTGDPSSARGQATTIATKFGFPA
eukprot:m.245178 g.245178  ORF g.245178 m.245178 type:complete len:342 (+) comp26634_c5_seq16:571-1596(+)